MEEAAGLPKIGDRHYKSYVGPPGQYDFMGATQFRLLCTLGLRAHHKLLDIGCGSLRVGRFLIPYLEAGNYYGIEPNTWLVDEIFEKEIGREIRKLKSPSFVSNTEFDSSEFGQNFDFVVAQSIFSHTGQDLLVKGLNGIARSLKKSGVALATFVLGDEDCLENGWFYVGTERVKRVTYKTTTIVEIARSSGMHCQKLPWYHPRQTWFLLTREAANLLPAKHLKFLHGAVLRDQEFVDSVRTR